MYIYVVLAAPRSIIDMERAAYLSAHTIDSSLLTCHYSINPSKLANVWIHGAFLLELTNSSDPVLSACFVARRWLLESLNKIDDLTARSKNIIYRELAHYTRWTASNARTDNPTMPPHYDRNPLPLELAAGYQSTNKSAWTFPPFVWR
jgi:hypothetical protein